MNTVKFLSVACVLMAASVWGRTVVVGGGEGNRVTAVQALSSADTLVKDGSDRAVIARDANVAGSVDVRAGTLALDSSILATASVSYWLDADNAATLFTNAAGGVTQWRSANGNAACFEVNGRAPACTNTRNSRRIITFDNDCATFSRLVSTNDLTQRTVYLCLAANRSPAVPSDAKLVFSSVWGWYGKGQIEHSLRYENYSGGWGLHLFPDIARFNGGSSAAYNLDGEWQVIGLFNTHADVPDKLYSKFRPAIGSYETWTPSNTLHGSVAEVVAFDRVLSVAEYEEVENHLAGKWGLANKVWHAGAETNRPVFKSSVDLTVRDGAVFDLNGVNQAIASLHGGGVITNSSPTPVTLTIGDLALTHATVAPNVTVKTNAGTKDWVCWPLVPQGGDYFVKSASKQAFTIWGRRRDPSVTKTGCLAIANLNTSVWTHVKLALDVRSVNGKAIRAAFTLSHRENGQVPMVDAPSQTIAGGAWRKVVLGLDSDFNMGDRSVDLLQVKIGAWIEAWQEDEEGGLEVRNLRICSAGDVTETRVWRPGDTFTSVPSRPIQRPAETPDALKVYFAFDNEDVTPSVDRHRNDAPDLQQYAGFRDEMLAYLDGAAVVTTNLTDAGVIVYSRARADAALAAQIAAAVRNGTPLYAASEIADPEIEVLLPCTIGHAAPQALPSRHRIVACNGAPDALADDLSEAAFGVYRACTARVEAVTHLAFADGTPALIEGRAGSGKVIYNMLCIGSSLVPGRESPDAFFVRALGYLTGRTLPERLRTRGSFAGWHDGLDARTFGRFGWEVGSGLLVGSLGNRLAVANNEAGYEWTAPRAGSAARHVTFAGDRAEALSLGGEIRIDGMAFSRLDASLGYPGVRWEFYEKDVELHLDNLQSYVVLPTVSGGRLVDLGTTDEIDAAEMSEPWLLLFNATARDTPLMLVFAHRPGAIVPMRDGLAVEGLRFSAEGTALGTVVPTWLHGADHVDTSRWTETVPESTWAAARSWCARAFAYPVACRERFCINETAGRVEIESSYSIKETVNDWGVVAARYAPVSPVAWALHDVRPALGGGEIARFQTDVTETDLATRYGMLAVRPGETNVAWSLPLFSPNLGLLPHSEGFPDMERQANRCFAGGVKYTCGGWVRVDYVKDKAEPFKVPAVYNINMHSHLMGIDRALQNPFILSPENRELLYRRFTWRFLEPLESIQYKMTCRWRREPVSGVKYTIYMNSPRDMSTQYEPAEYGSEIIYGDSNETVRMILAAAQKAEDRLGQFGIVKANWDALSRQVPSYAFALDDWINLCAGCLEYGGPGTIDMLNAEFGGMMTLARLAEIADDGELRAQALYRAARRSCPTLARFHMRSHFATHGYFDDLSKRGICLGFNESGAEFPLLTRTPDAIDFYDMSQGIPQDIVSLYDWHGKDVLRESYLPKLESLTGTEGALDYYLVAVMALAGQYTGPWLLQKLYDVENNTAHINHLPEDWPGMGVGTYMEYALARIADAPLITDCRNVELHEATWNPARRKLTLEFTPSHGAGLAVNGRPLADLAAGRRETRVIGLGGMRVTVR